MAGCLSADGGAGQCLAGAVRALAGDAAVDPDPVQVLGAGRPAVGPPQRHLDQARLHHVPAVEQRGDLRAGAQGDGGGGLVVHGGGVPCGGGADVRGGVGEGQVAAFGQRGAEGGQDAGRVLLFGDEVHDRHQQQGDGLAEVDERADLRVGQDSLGFAQVGQDDAGGAAAGQQRVGVHVHDGVVVDVGDPGARRGLGGDLVHVPGGRDAGADVDDLPDARLPGQEPHGPLQERPVGSR